MESYAPVGSKLDDVLCIRPEASLEEGDLMLPSSVLRLRVERGDFPYSSVQYSSLSTAPAYWSEWVDAVVSDDDHRRVLKHSHILEAIKISQSLTLNKRNKNLDFLMSRWSTDTHTFVFPWGEFSPTLQDTSALLHLSSRGKQEFDPAKARYTD